MESIHELFMKVQEHPDYAGGALFTRDDVYDAVFVQEPDEYGEHPEHVVARVTDGMLRQSQKAMEAYIFSSAYMWDEAMRDNIEIEEVE